MGIRKGRGRLSSVDLLPDECTEIISWAANELAARERTQIDIYVEFKTKLIALQGEIGLGFDIPSASAFNRYSVRLAQLTRRLEQTREIAKTISGRFDAESSDELTMITAEAIKTLCLELLEAGGAAGFSPKAAMELANALRAAAAAQSVSTSRRQKVEKEFAQQAETVIETVAQETGLSDEAVASLRVKLLGLKKAPSGG